MAAVHQGTAPGVMCLRSVNPYVAAALGDWGKRVAPPPLVPRTPVAAPQLHALDATVGERVCAPLGGAFLAVVTAISVEDSFSGEPKAQSAPGESCDGRGGF